MARAPTPLPNHVRGWGPVETANGHAYRRYLMRVWRQPGQELRTVLWLGMNPSTANATHEDHTCKIERRVSERLGFNRYFKANILDIMETNSRNLVNHAGFARSRANIRAIRTMLTRADLIILSHGDLDDMFAGHMNEAYAEIRRSEAPKRYFTLNARSRNPAHTLRSSRLGLLGEQLHLHDFQFPQ